LNNLLNSLTLKLQNKKTNEKNLPEINSNTDNSSEEVSNILKYLINNAVISNEEFEKIINNTKTSSELITNTKTVKNDIQNIKVKIVEIAKKALTSS